MCLAVPGRILSVDIEGDVNRCGHVDFEGIVRVVNLSCVPDAGIDDYVLVHAGVAISKLDEAEAARTLELLRQMSESGQNDSEVP